MVHIILEILILCNDRQNVYRGIAPSKTKDKQSIGKKLFYSNTSYGFECKRICISNVFIKMFIKRKTKADYEMILSFKTSVKRLTSRRITVSVVEQLSADISQFFVGHCPVSFVNIQAY